MKTDTSQTNFDPSAQENYFIESGVISPIFIKNNHGIRYAIFYRNKWEGSTCQKQFQKTVGRIFDDDSVELGKKFLSQFPALKDCKATLSGRTICLAGPNIAVLPPLDPMAQQRQAFFDELDQNTRLSAGASYVLWQIAQQTHLLADLEDVFGKNRAAVLLSLAIFFASDPGAVASEFEIYSHHTWLPCSPLSSQEVSEVFQSILNPEVMRFLHKRIQHSKSSEQNSLYWSFDTTSISSYSETIRKTAYGYSKENPELPQLNLGLIVSENSGEPLYYKVLEGSISDPLALRQLLVDTAQLDTSNVSLVMDRAFSSPSLLDQLYKNNLGFICGSKTNLNYCKSVINSFARELQLGGVDTFLEEYGLQAKTSSTTWSYYDPSTGYRERKPLYIHVYLDPFRAAGERETLLKKLKKLQKKIKAKSPLNKPEADLRKQFFIKGSLGWAYDKELWQQNEKLLGLFVLVSSSVSSAAEALRIYRQRDIVEKNFNNLKERCSGRRMRCQESTLEGKVFALFLSLILLMNLKMRFHRAREEENCQEEKAKFLPDDVPDFLRSLSVIDVTSRKSENNQFFYWDLIPKKIRLTLEAIGIKEPPRFIT